MHGNPCVQTESRLPGTVWRGLIFFTTDRPHYILKCPRFPGTITAEWFWLCVRSQCHHISRMRTFDENSCAISITSPRLLSSPRTQHVWWDHREKSRRASTLWDCRGKSCLAGLSPVNGTQSERGDSDYMIFPTHFIVYAVWGILPPVKQDLWDRFMAPCPSPWSGGDWRLYSIHPGSKSSEIVQTPSINGSWDQHKILERSIVKPLSKVV